MWIRLTRNERGLSLFVHVNDTVLVFDARSLERDVAVLIPADGSVAALQVVQRDPGRVDVLVNTHQVRLVRIQNYAQS